MHREAAQRTFRGGSLAPEVPAVSDAVLENADEEYLEAMALDRLGAARGRPPR